jgi:hypothetical protein
MAEKKNLNSEHTLGFRKERSQVAQHLIPYNYSMKIQ